MAVSIASASRGNWVCVPDALKHRIVCAYTNDAETRVPDDKVSGTKGLEVRIGTSVALKSDRV